MLKYLSYASRNSANLNVKSSRSALTNWYKQKFDRTGASSAPVAIKIGVNSVCNARCKTCDIGIGDPNSIFSKNLNVGKSLDFALAKKILREASAFRPKITIDSTEPFLYKPLFDLIHEVKSSGMRCFVQTNGITLKRYASEVSESGLDELGISIDGTETIHDDIRGIPGMYNKIWSGLDRLSNYNEIPKLKLNFVISEHNQDNLINFLSFVERSGIKFDGINLYHQNYISHAMAQQHNESWGYCLPVTETNCKEANPTNINVDVLLNQIETIRRNQYSFPIKWIPNLFTRSRIHDYYYNPNVIMHHQSCVIPWHIIRVLPDGTSGVISRCYFLQCGDLNEVSLLEAFNHKAMMEFRKTMQKEGLLPACNRCCAIF